jgi:predicted dehydrogenase
MEIFSEGRVVRMDNFRRTEGYGFGKFKQFKTRSQDKGHGVQFNAFVDRVIAGGEPLIAFEQLVNVTRATFAAVTSAKEGRVVEVERG